MMPCCLQTAILSHLAAFLGPCLPDVLDLLLDQLALQVVDQGKVLILLGNVAQLEQLKGRGGRLREDNGNGFPLQGSSTVRRLNLRDKRPRLASVLFTNVITER